LPQQVSLSFWERATASAILRATRQKENTSASEQNPKTTINFFVFAAAKPKASCAASESVRSLN